MKTYPFDALQEPLKAERQWLLIAASAATLWKRGVDGEAAFLSQPETPEGRFAPERGMWRNNQQRRGRAASAADFVSQTGMFSSAARLTRDMRNRPVNPRDKLGAKNSLASLMMYRSNDRRINNYPSDVA